MRPQSCPASRALCSAVQRHEKQQLRDSVTTNRGFLLGFVSHDGLTEVQASLQTPLPLPPEC